MRYLVAALAMGFVVASAPAFAQFGGFAPTISTPNVSDAISDSVKKALGDNDMPKECEDIKDQDEQVKCIEKALNAPKK